MQHTSVNGNTVKIRLEVDFSCGFHAPITLIVGDTRDTVLPPPVAPGPQVGLGNPANVKVSGSGTSGVVCVTGVEPTANIPFQIAVLVQDPTLPIPSTPPSDAIIIVPNSSGEWQINEVPGAVCAWAGTGVTFPQNELIIWKQYSFDGPWYEYASQFRGQCSDHTDCSSTSQTVSAQARLMWSPRVIDTVALAWTLNANGFKGTGIDEFNGTWHLVQFPQTAPGHLAWIAGGDGVRQPRVELFGQACGCSPFELRFSLSGVTVSYRFTRDSWNPVGVNHSASISTSGLPEGSEIPGQMQVIPA